MLTLIHLAPLFIALGAFAIGFGALFFPVKSSQGFGIKVDDKHKAYVQVSGARDLFLGCIYLHFWLVKDFHSLAVICFFTAIVSLSDFIITHQNGGKLKSYAHLFATIAVCLLGFLLYSN